MINNILKMNRNLIIKIKPFRTNISFNKNNLLLNDMGKPLGRWKIDYCPIKIDKKVDFANEDNCGVCSQYEDKNISESSFSDNLSIEELEILFNARVIE
jgi:hypothetical protein